MARAVSQEHDPSHSFGLLRTRRARPHDHAAEQRDERAAINRCDHSVTAPARWRGTLKAENSGRSSFWQIRNCSRHIGVVDQLEAAFTAGLAGRGVRSVFGICGEGLDCFRRWKLQKRYKRGIQRLAFQRLHVPAAEIRLAQADRFGNRKDDDFMKKVSRRFLTVSGAAGLAVLAGGRSLRAQGHVGLSPFINQATIFMANDLGYFSKMGLDIRMKIFMDGALVVAPMLSGEVVIGAMTPNAGFFNS